MERVQIQELWQSSSTNDPNPSPPYTHTICNVTPYGEVHFISPSIGYGFSLDLFWKVEWGRNESVPALRPDLEALHA
jgi:hypothetical protein